MFGVLVELRFFELFFSIIHGLFFHMPKRKKSIFPKFQAIVGIVLWLEKTTNKASVDEY